MARNHEIEIIKKAHKIESWSPEMEEEILKCALDPIYFIETYVMIQHATQGRLIVELYDYQKDLIKAFHEHRNVITLASRQMGKTNTHDTIITCNDTRVKIGNLIKKSMKLKFISFLENILLALVK